MGKLIYDTLKSNAYKEKEISTKLSEYTETVVVNNWETDCIKNSLNSGITSLLGGAIMNVQSGKKL